MMPNDRYLYVFGGEGNVMFAGEKLDLVERIDLQSKTNFKPNFQKINIKGNKFLKGSDWITCTTSSGIIISGGDPTLKSLYIFDHEKLEISDTGVKLIEPDKFNQLH